MRPPGIVSVTVEVAVDPAAAFAIFTEEIGQWWRPGPINWNDSRRAVGIRIEPGVGGRWLEVYNQATGEGFECGRILVWEPGVRLIFLYRDAGRVIDDTEVEIRFEAIDGGTRVTLEHRGWDKLLPDIADEKRKVKRWGWANILGWFKEWVFWGTPRRVDSDLLGQRVASGYVLGPGEGISGAGSGVKAGRTSTGGSLTLIESRARGGAPLHVHSREDECFYVVEGSITVRCGEDVFEAGPRSFVFLPRGIPHAWDVSGKGVATLLIIAVPAGFEDFLREHHEAGSMPDDVKNQIAAKYGIRWIV
jgi:mannose-6-phosphate isomerase-like protein (cupin superfamily)